MTKRRIGFLDELCQRIVASVHALKIGSGPENTASAVRGVLRNFFSVSEEENVPAKNARKKKPVRPKKSTKPTKKPAKKKQANKDPERTAARAEKIIAAVQERGLTSREIAEVTGLNKRGMAASLRELVRQGKLEALSAGQYRVAATVAASAS